jgi:hypothetical protein
VINDETLKTLGSKIDYFVGMFSEGAGEGTKAVDTWTWMLQAGIAIYLPNDNPDSGYQMYVKLTF